MRKHHSHLLLLSLTLVLSLVTVMAALRRQGQSAPTASAQRGVDDSEEPVADYDASDPTDEKKRAKRKAKNGRFPKGRLEESICSREVLIIRGAWLERLAAFPVALSDSIVIGTITGAQAYVSSDKTGVYSEFAVYLEDILKNSSRTPFNVGNTIATEREGGRIRYRSGCIRRYKFHRQGIPHAGRRYLFFLRYTEQGDTPYILTAYELRAGRVFPLDGLDETTSNIGNTLPQFAAYENADETEFLDALRKALKESPSASAAEVG